MDLDNSPNNKLLKDKIIFIKERYFNKTLHNKNYINLILYDLKLFLYLKLKLVYFEK